MLVHFTLTINTPIYYMYYGVTRLVCQLREHDSISPRKDVLDWSTLRKWAYYSPFLEVMKKW